MKIADICRHNDLSVAAAEKHLAAMQEKGLIRGFVPGKPDAEISLTDKASPYKPEPSCDE